MIRTDRTLPALDPFRLFWPSMTSLVAVVMLVLPIFCLVNERDMFGRPLLEAPICGFCVDKPVPYKNQFLVELVENSRTRRIEIRGGTWRRGYTVPLEQFKWYLYPFARLRIDPKTKWSVVPIRVRAPGHVPFSEVQKIFAIFLDRDIQVYRVFLETS